MSPQQPSMELLNVGKIISTLSKICDSMWKLELKHTSFMFSRNSWRPHLHPCILGVSYRNHICSCHWSCKIWIVHDETPLMQERNLPLGFLISNMYTLTQSVEEPKLQLSDPNGNHVTSPCTGFSLIKCLKFIFLLPLKWFKWTSHASLCIMEISDRYLFCCPTIW